MEPGLFCNDHPPAAASDSTGSFGVLQLVQNLLVVQGTVTVVDESVPQPPLLHLIVTQGALSSEMMGRRAKLYLSGELPQGLASDISVARSDHTQ